MKSEPWTEEERSEWLYGRFGRELTEWQRGELSAAAEGLFHRSGMMCQGLSRFNTYRRWGLTTVEAFEAALAWCRNSVEQYTRRLSHDTGAEGWRKMSALDQEYWAGVG